VSANALAEPGRSVRRLFWAGKPRACRPNLFPRGWDRVGTDSPRASTRPDHMLHGGPTTEPCHSAHLAAMPRPSRRFRHSPQDDVLARLPGATYKRNTLTLGSTGVPATSVATRTHSP
jgi:hypothetical protein